MTDDRENAGDEEADPMSDCSDRVEEGWSVFAGDVGVEPE